MLQSPSSPRALALEDAEQSISKLLTNVATPSMGVPTIPSVGLTTLRRQRSFAATLGNPRPATRKRTGEALHCGATIAAQAPLTAMHVRWTRVSMAAIAAPGVVPAT